MALTKILIQNTVISAVQSHETINVWYGRIKTQDDDYSRYWQMLDTNEQHYAQALKNDVIRKRYVAVHGQLKILLTQILNQSSDSIVIHKGLHGKPYLADYPQLAFNLSHSDNVFMIAIGWYCQLGIDLEKPKVRPNFPALVKKCFAPEEALYWQQLPDEQKTAEFYRFWTRKEAFVKATGFGIALGLQQCVINPEQPSSFLRIPVQCGDATRWYMRDIELPQLESTIIYSALSSNKPITTVRLIKLL